MSGIVDAAAFASEQAHGVEAAAVSPNGDITDREAGALRDAPGRSPKAGLGGGQQSPGSNKGGSPGGSVGVGVFRSLLRGGSSNGGSGARMSRSNSGAQPTCLICLEPLTSEDFLVSAALGVYEQLQCLTALEDACTSDKVQANTAERLTQTDVN